MEFLGIDVDVDLDMGDLDINQQQEEAAASVAQTEAAAPATPTPAQVAAPAPAVTPGAYNTPSNNYNIGMARTPAPAATSAADDSDLKITSSLSGEEMVLMMSSFCEASRKELKLMVGGHGI